MLPIRKLLSASKIRYLLVGGSSVLLEYGSFLTLVMIMGGGAVTANAVSFLIGLVYTFLLHNKWTFSGDHTHGMRGQFIAYATLAAINLALTSLLIGLQVDVLDIAPFIAKLVCMALVVVWNYLLLSKIIFKRAGESS